ncbi:Uncharacterized protein TCM_037771 [Theobroma cacao]|uniref:Uncharacterized protein n=1 Tax=Theobroma cacao TaxID=3641 RepID=A0A061GL90_THECC|nr:Uncharacterized protein TCM_037771 [Theobroma cacao]
MMQQHIITGHKLDIGRGHLRPHPPLTRNPQSYSNLTLILDRSSSQPHTMEPILVKTSHTERSPRFLWAATATSAAQTAPN